MDPTSIKDMAALKFTAETFEVKYNQTLYELEKCREESRITKNQLELTETALKQTEQKLNDESQRVQKLEDELKIYEALKQRSHAAVVGLQKVAHESQEQVTQLEIRLRNLTENSKFEHATLESKANEATNFLTNLAPRIGLKEDKIKFDEALDRIIERLDHEALLELQCAQIDAELTKTKNELDEVRKNTTELTKRTELNFSERKILTDKINLKDAENNDLKSQLTLLQNMSQARETLLKELRHQIQQLTQDKEIQEAEARKASFKAQVESVQMKSLLTSLAATLSTVEENCPDTETGVKEAVIRLLDRVKKLKEAGCQFQAKVGELEQQFEAQHKSGLFMNTELKQARQRVFEAENDRCQMATELDGLKLINRKECEIANQVRTILLTMADNLAVPTNRDDLANLELASICSENLERLLKRGCLHWVCVESLPINDHQHTRSNQNDDQFSPPRISCPYCNSKPIDTTPPTNRQSVCDHRSVVYLLEQIISNQGHLTPSETDLADKLCTLCVRNLIQMLGNRLAELDDQIRSIPKPPVGDRKRSDQLVANLQDEVEQKQVEVMQLNRQLASVQKQKDSEIKELTQIVENLEKSRKIQARKLQKLEQKSDVQNVENRNDLSALRLAKKLLVDTQEKKNQLSTFRDIIGRMLDVDTRFVPDADSVIIHRLKQLLTIASTPIPTGLLGTGPVWPTGRLVYHDSGTLDAKPGSQQPILYSSLQGDKQRCLPQPNCTDKPESRRDKQTSKTRSSETKQVTSQQLIKRDQSQSKLDDRKY